MMIAVYFLAVVGAAVALVAIFGIACVTIDTFRDWRHEPHQRSFYEGTQHVRNRLLADAYWFSESAETVQLVQDLANGMDVSSARQRWRKSREASNLNQNSETP